jgi:hypothetical protein
LEYIQLAAKRHRNHKSSEAAPQTEDLKTEDRRQKTGKLDLIADLAHFCGKKYCRAN